jgi:glucokinase
MTSHAVLIVAADRRPQAPLQYLYVLRPRNGRYPYAMARLVAGVDLGGTKIQSVILRNRTVVGRNRIPTPRSGAGAVLAAMAESVVASVADAGASLADLAAVGVGTPGAVDEASGSVSHAANVPGFDPGPVPLADSLRQSLGGPQVKVENDVRVAVLGEWKRGAGRPYRDLMGVFVGTGVGGGLVLEGRLRIGRGAAGEIGHTLVKEGGRRCGCGRRGHLEAYAGRASIEATARKMLEKGRKTKLFEIMEKKGRDRVTSGVIADALDRHDRVTEELIEEAVWALGIALSNAANLLDLEAIIVGGGLGDRLGKAFVERVEKAAAPQLFTPERPPAFLTTELGDLGGAVGAAVLAGG